MPERQLAGSGATQHAAQEHSHASLSRPADDHDRPRRTGDGHPRTGPDLGPVQVQDTWVGAPVESGAQGITRGRTHDRIACRLQIECARRLDRQDPVQAATAQSRFTEADRPAQPHERPAGLDIADHAVKWEFPIVGRAFLHYLPLPRDYDWATNPTDDREFPYAMNRHRFWFALGHAYALTGRDEYAQAWAEQFDAWDACCPAAALDRAKRPFWRILEPAIRAVNWAMLYFAVLNSQAMTPIRHARMLYRLWEFGDQLAR